MEQPEARKNRSWIAVLSLVVVVVVAGVVLPRFRAPTSREVQGTITSVDAATGTATIEFTDPANGAVREVTGAVPDSCAITIDGSKAALEDLRPGDTVIARATIERVERDGDRETQVTAESLRVTRTGRAHP